MPNRTDFNGDGRDDVFWFLNSELPWLPESLAWFGQSDGSFEQLSGDLGVRGWDFPATGDFDGNGSDDFFFLRPYFFTRLWGFASYENGNFVLTHSGFVPGWSVAGSEDFNNDGRDDILARHGDGSLVQWLVQPNFSLDFFNPPPASWIHPNWHVAGTGDFNKDGRGDVLLRHDDGWLVQWLTELDGSFSDNSAARSWIHPDWHVAGTGDFNKDGYEDVVLRNRDGWVVEWLGQADGSFAENSAANFWLHPAWHHVGTGDYNGDGYYDLLVRHDDGTVNNWLGGQGGTFFDNTEVASLQISWAYTNAPYGWEY